MFELQEQKIQYGDLVVLSTIHHPFRIGIIATKTLKSSYNVLQIYFPLDYLYAPRSISISVITYIRAVSVEDLYDSPWLKWLPNCQNSFQFHERVKKTLKDFLKWHHENSPITLLTREEYFREFAKKELNLK